MSRCFLANWFYQAFNKPDCVIHYADSEIDVMSEADSTPEQQDYLHSDTKTLGIHMSIDTSDFSARVVLLNTAKNLRSVLDREDCGTAYNAFGRVIRERYGMGIVSCWHLQSDRNIPGYRPLNDLELSLMQEMLSAGSYRKWMFRTAREALHGMDDFIAGTAADLDKMEVYDPDVLDWLNCAVDMKRKILRFGLPEVTEPNMFYGIEFSRTGFKVKYYYLRFTYENSVALENDCKSAGKPTVSGYFCTMMSSKMPWLSSAEYAERWKVSEETVLNWIRHGEIRTVVEDEGGWRILSGSIPTIRKFVPQTYILLSESIPEETVTAYPFLSGLSAEQWFQIREKKQNAYSVLLIPAGKPDAEGVSIVELNRREREQFEYDLLRADWVKYDMRESMMRMDNLPK